KFTITIRGRLAGPHPGDDPRRLPQARDDRREMAEGAYFEHAYPGACLSHRLEVRRDVVQRRNRVAPRADEDEPAAIETPEPRPLKIGPCHFEPGQRPAAQDVLLPRAV